MSGPRTKTARPTLSVVNPNDEAPPRTCTAASAVQLTGTAVKRLQTGPSHTTTSKLSPMSPDPRSPTGSVTPAPATINLPAFSVVASYDSAVLATCGPFTLPAAGYVKAAPPPSTSAPTSPTPHEEDDRWGRSSQIALTLIESSSGGGDAAALPVSMCRTKRPHFSVQRVPRLSDLVCLQEDSEAIAADLQAAALAGNVRSHAHAATLCQALPHLFENDRQRLLRLHTGSIFQAAGPRTKQFGGSASARAAIALNKLPVKAATDAADSLFSLDLRDAGGTEAFLAPSKRRKKHVCASSERATATMTAAATLWFSLPDTGEAIDWMAYVSPGLRIEYNLGGETWDTGYVKESPPASGW